MKSRLFELRSLPLDRAGRLRREIVENSVDAIDLGGDAGYDLVKDVVGDLLDRGSHSVLGIDGADDRGPALVSGVVLNADGLHIGNDYEVLPYALGETGLRKLIAEDSICLAECRKSVTGDSAKASYAKAGAGEGLTVNHSVRKTERLADYSYLVLIEKLDGLNELKLEILGKSADVVVRLDCLFALSLLNRL